MAEKTKIAEAELAPPPQPEKDIAEEKVVVPPPAEEKPDNSKALVVSDSEFFYKCYIANINIVSPFYFFFMLLIWIYEAMIPLSCMVLLLEK
jgi:Remorin, N-terminal region